MILIAPCRKAEKSLRWAQMCYQSCTAKKLNIDLDVHRKALAALAMSLWYRNGRPIVSNLSLTREYHWLPWHVTSPHEALVGRWIAARGRITLNHSNLRSKSFTKGPSIGVFDLDPVTGTPPNPNRKNNTNLKMESNEQLQKKWVISRTGLCEIDLTSTQREQKP
jgi:hypothetical protein